MWGMAVLEGKHRDFWQSLEWAAETLTTTGYGADPSWRHPLMVLLVVTVQFLGVLLVFLIFPIYLIPFLEERFETRLPQEVPKDLHGHAVIYRYGPAVETLLEELAGAGVPTLVLEGDDATARRLFERGGRGVHPRLRARAPGGGTPPRPAASSSGGCGWSTGGSAKERCGRPGWRARGRSSPMAATTRTPRSASRPASSASAAPSWRWSRTLSTAGP